jgi:hypothetical protein
VRSLHLAAVLLATTLLAGCGGIPVPNGETGCGGADYGTGNRESAGAYTGTYTNAVVLSTAFQPKNLDLQLTVAEDSTITGTVTEAATGRTAAVAGHLGDWFEPCADDTTTFELDFTFEGEAPRVLTATKKRGAFTTFSATGRYYRRSDTEGQTAIGRGQFTVTRS